MESHPIALIMNSHVSFTFGSTCLDMFLDSTEQKTRTLPSSKTGHWVVHEHRKAFKHELALESQLTEDRLQFKT